MAGSKATGLKASETIKKLYGEDFYVKAGRIGGKAPVGGLSGKPELARKIGAIGGSKSRRGYTFLKYEGVFGVYQHKETGEIKKIQLK